MLAADRRLTDSESFRRTVRAGRRAGTPALVVHAMGREAGRRAQDPSRIGFVVNRAVGGSVTRNRVKRRLRHLVRGHLDLIPAGVDLVVRAQPLAAGLTGAELDHQLVGCLRRVLPEPSL